MLNKLLSREKIRTREVTTELQKAHCQKCAHAVDQGLVGTQSDCPLRGTFHGDRVPVRYRLFDLIPVMTLRTHNLITNLGHAAANGRMSNQGSYSPFVNIAIGLGTNTVGATDLALFNEATGNGSSRAAATATQVTTTVTNDTTQLVKTFSFTASFAVTEEGIFDNATAPTETTTTQSRINTDTSVTVTSGTGIANNDYLQWEQEIVQVTAGGGTGTLTITRAAKGTTAASHASGTTVNDITANAGNLLAHQGFAAVNVNNGDSLQITHKYQT